MEKKFYVVWAGRETGIFTEWAYTKQQVDQFPGAKYKSFKTREEAELAFAGRNSPTKKASKPGTTKTKTSEMSTKKFDVTIFCDGACDPNPGKAGSGLSVYCGNALTELWYGLYNPNGTNNSAELNALHQALLIAQKNITEGKTVHIRCDSKYSISCITEWAFSWKQKGWKRKISGDIKNLEIIQKAHELYLAIKNEVVVSHVKAHIGIEGNELADRMALYGVVQQATAFCQYSGPLDIQQVLSFKADTF